MHPVLNKVGVFIAAGVVGATLITACGAQPAVNITLTDMKIDSSIARGSAGNIVFHIKNAATATKHEFVVIQSDQLANTLPLDADGNVVEDQLTSPGEKGDIEPGQTVDLTLNLAAGHYALICNEPGHYQAGMKFDFVVQ
jgi:uncharacterized cupredoxin-like copper-binding protein